MTKEEQYHFSDFTMEHYSQLLGVLSGRLKFIGYEDLPSSDPFAIMRHDVDFSPQRALKMAEIEYRAGVKSTYFWLLHSEFYNLLDKDTVAIVHKIQGMGHRFGIHFDTHFYQIKSEKEIEAALQKELTIIRTVFDVNPAVFSFHNTNEFIMSCQKPAYAGLINTYSHYFQNDVTYCSDSNGYWRFERMLDVAQNENYTKLHLLTHPENWTDEAMSPYQRILRAIHGRANSNIEYYNNLLTAAGRKIIE
jgi:hypothetical protein